MKRYVAIMAVALVVAAAIFYVSSIYGRAGDPIDPRVIVGQNIIAGIQGPELDEANLGFLERIKPGAIILYKYNIKGETELRMLISSLQEIAVRTTGHRYLIMIDEEPGGATRLGLFRDAFDASGKPDWTAIERDARKLRELGIDVVLSPLADLEFGSKGSVTHRMPIRSEEELMRFNARFIALLRSKGLGATLKHFPGLGLLPADTHMYITHSSASTSTLMRSVSLFKSGIAAGADLVMTNHAVYDAIDPGRSASLSKNILALLRDGAGFKGIAITDDLTNMPIGEPYQIATDRAAIEALKAGHTMVMLGFRRILTQDTYDRLLKAYEDDRELRNIMSANFKKMIEYKDARRAALGQ